MAIQAEFPFHNTTQDLMENGCGGFNSNNHLYCNHQQQCFIQPHKAFRFESSTDNSKSQSMALYDDKQRQELDHLLRLQNERLRMLLQEQRRSQVAVIMKRLETKVVPFMRQKEEEIARASKRNMELEEFMRRLEMENQIWQRVAQDNEAMIMSLNTTIEQVKDKAIANSSCHNNKNGGVDDAESCCEELDQKHTRNEEGGSNVEMKMMCKVCNSRKVCVLFLPCRHLCSCKSCEALLHSCPVCQSLKKATIEALMV